MRILMTTDTVGGVWTYALELARALGRFDVATTLVTLGPGPSRDQWREAARIPSLDVLDAGFALEWMDDPWREVDAAGAWLLELEEVAPRIGWPIKVIGDPRPPHGAAVSLADMELLGRLPRDEVRGWMDRASIFCHPARYEPFGLGPLEAAASGCALVLGDIETLREVWRGAAIYVPPDDPDAIAWAIERLASDPLLLRRQATRARCHAARFDAAAQATAYRRVYECITAIRAEVSE